ncbi:hypothetical protein [Singulisphaera sp. PoT]|uniref:hypothetical protein n=1 Tax=Singulisphaera sp. PoT TaxID=3411797 RepID=UPI003BF61A94
MAVARRVDVGVFLILLVSYAYFWHSRDWNSSSRLMLAYALGDRGTVSLDGLDQQTGDIAHFKGHYYCDKLPGFPILATPVYLVLKLILQLPSHPLGQAAIAYWKADYWVTLGTSGVITALTGVILAGLARDLGCGPRRSAIVALAYGLATPAYAYATLAYGHQASAFALLASFALLWRVETRRTTLRMVTAGSLAAYASVVELQVGPISAILGLYLLAQVIGGRRKVSTLGDFTVGALVPSLLLLGYNQLAFGSPWDMGYFHHATAIFRDVHSAKNPLGMGAPNWSHALPLVWGGHRGILFYAPILLLSIPGWVFLLLRRWYGVGIVSALVCAAVFLVNLAYPEWSGGWSTGPRLLVPLLPFAMLPVAGLLSTGWRPIVAIAGVLSMAGGAILLLFQGAGARIPQDILDPLREFVWPRWAGEPLPANLPGTRFDRTVIDLIRPDAFQELSPSWQWLQFVPLVVVQLGLVGLLLVRLRPSNTNSDTTGGEAEATAPDSAV